MTARQQSAAHEQWLDEVLDFKDAAALRKVSVQTLRSLVRQGRLVAVRLSERKRGMSRREALRSMRD